MGDPSAGLGRGTGCDEHHGVVAGGTRASGPVITGQVDPIVWQATSRRLRGLLRKRGANSWMAEDLAQEVLVRAVANDIAFIDSDDLMRWCTPVAVNLHIDHVRRGRWADDSGAIPEAREPVDVERLVLARLELDRVLHHLGTLKATERQAIVDGVNGVTRGDGRQAAVGEAVRRHRARQRLARLVAGAAAAWGWLVHPRLRITRPALITALPAAFLSTLALVPWVASEPAVPPIAVAAQPGAFTAQASSDHLAGRSREVMGRHSAPDGVPARTAIATAPARRVPVLRQEDPMGHVIDIGTRDRPVAGVLVCVEDLPVVADTCLASPVEHEAASATVVISSKRTG